MKLVTPYEYVRELNKRLAMHPDFRTGMRFLLSPEGTGNDVSGIDWEPKNIQHPFIEISSNVKNELVAK